MVRVGCHLSSSEGYQAVAKDAVKTDASTFQFSTWNPRGGNAKTISEKNVKASLLRAEKEDIFPILMHVPYTLDACSAGPRLRDFARRTTADNLVRMEYTPGNMHNFHPGYHVKQGVDVGVSYIAETLSEVPTSEQITTVLLETMAGKGSETGVTFQELKQILGLVDSSDHTGACLDTCHAWGGGCDIANHLEEVLDEPDQVIELNRLKAIHLNDSQNPLGAHKDRHARFGEGHIGIGTSYKIMIHPILSKPPFYLETPSNLDGYRGGIHMIRGVADL